MRVAEYFNSVYRSDDRYWWREDVRYATNPDAHPHSLLAQQTLRLLAGKPAGRALDLGAGEGADSIRLALLGYVVDAVDISEVAADKLRRYADDAGVGARVRVTVSDVESYEPSGKYDVVICNGLLHYVEDKTPVIIRMQEATRLSGCNVISLWSDFTPVPRCHNAVPVHLDKEDGEVVKLYNAWPKELMYFERDKAESSHSDLPPHRHSHIKLIASRTS
jgi:SAM-dependent methyltransferase